MPESAPKILVFFDGTCSLCNGFVDFILKRELEGKIVFASLQGFTAQKRLAEHLLTKAIHPIDSILVLDLQTSGIKTEAAALCQIFATMGLPWQLLSFLGNRLPMAIQNNLYRLVARHRYSWFGQKDICRTPSASEKNRLWN